MVWESPLEDKNIVSIHSWSFIRIKAHQHTTHQCMEHRLGIHKSKRHHPKLIKPVGSGENSLLQSWGACISTSTLMSCERYWSSDTDLTGNTGLSLGQHWEVCSPNTSGGSHPSSWSPQRAGSGMSFRCLTTSCLTAKGMQCTGCWQRCASPVSTSINTSLSSVTRINAACLVMFSQIVYKALCLLRV